MGETVEESAAILHRVAGPSPTNVGKSILRPLHVMALPGTLTDSGGAEVPVVNLYVLDRKPEDSGHGMDPQAVMMHPDVLRLVVAVEDVPQLVEYLETTCGVRAAAG